ncbi:hypothetical protein F4774DRAFT_378138 [Daldinia eschscholtzii]|nr:hypothetical protein F4774DRAFT_378138 [Daldinia eschscholtzii]
MHCYGAEYPWQHAQGPIMIYMADCGGPCNKWDGLGKRWFKIWESGYYKSEWSHELSGGKIGQLTEEEKCGSVLI